MPLRGMHVGNGRSDLPTNVDGCSFYVVRGFAHGCSFYVVRRFVTDPLRICDGRSFYGCAAWCVVWCVLCGVLHGVVWCVVLCG